MSTSSRKRGREADVLPPPRPSTPLDAIAAFLALHSPPVKLPRSSLYSFIPPRLPSPSRWSDLPLDLLTSVCHFLPSWKDLIRLSRVHRHLHSHIHSVSVSGADGDNSKASCWAYVEAVKVRQDAKNLTVNDRRLQLRAKSNKTPASSASFHPRSLPFDPSVVDIFFSLGRSGELPSAEAVQDGQRCLALLGQPPRLLSELILAVKAGRAAWRPTTFFGDVSPLHLNFFSSLHLLPRVHFVGDTSVHSAAFFFALPTFHNLRHLTLTFLFPRGPLVGSDARAQQALARVAHHALSGLHSLRSLVLTDPCSHFGVVEAESLLPLSLCHLQVYGEMLTDVLLHPFFAQSPLSRSLQSLVTCELEDFQTLPQRFRSLRHLHSKPNRWPLSIRLSRRGGVEPIAGIPSKRASVLQSWGGRLSEFERAVRTPTWSTHRCSLVALTIEVTEATAGQMPHLAALTALTELTVHSKFRHGEVADEAVLPFLPSRWLPQLPQLTHLNLECPALLTEAVLLDLFQASLDDEEDEQKAEEEKEDSTKGARPERSDRRPESKSGIREDSAKYSEGEVAEVSELREERPSLIDGLVSFGLQVDARLVAEAVVWRWRRRQCTRLRKACVEFMESFLNFSEFHDGILEWNRTIARDLIGEAACTRAQLHSAELHHTFLRRVGMEL